MTSAPADRARRFSLGAQLSRETLAASPYAALAELQAHEPVSWVPELDGWLVTDRDLGIQVMRDAKSFTVDDPRFTTAAVLGQSMLSLDGDDHQRHRLPFAPAFRANAVREHGTDRVHEYARSLVSGIATQGHAELRTALAGPLAVRTIADFLGIVDADPADILSWYEGIAQAILSLTTGGSISANQAQAVRALRRQVDHSLAVGDPTSLLGQVQASGNLTPNEIMSGAAVIMFGAIETSEGMTANALWHLLQRPQLVDQVRADRSLLPALIDESLRLEPAAAVIDRYTTVDVQLGSVTIPGNELVTVSLLASNRDPAVFPEPDLFDISRPNTRQHVTFVQGPHGCLGVHLARLETTAALEAVLDTLPNIGLDGQASTNPHGLIFRKPQHVVARWT